jgi:hypothetical protein
VWKNVPKRSKGPGSWDDKKRLEVLQSYILLANLRQAAALNGVPEITAKKWKLTQWWKETEDELRRSSKLQLSNKLTELVNKSLGIIADRLENGDFVFNPRTGQFIRKGVSAEHANKIATQLIDRTLAVEKSATTERVSDEGLDARLMKLREEMLRFAKAKVIVGEVIDVEPIQGDLTNDRNSTAGQNTRLGIDSSEHNQDGLGRQQVSLQESPESQPQGVNPS